MNRLLLFLPIIVLFASCRKPDPIDDKPKEDVFSNKNWMRIRIPSGGEVLAVAGSVDDTLLVTTLYNTFIVTDKGNKFTLTNKNINRTPGLLIVQDTIYAFNGDSYDAKFETRYATFPSYYTLDKGLTWHNNVSKRASTYILLGTVTDKKNITYKLNYRRGPDNNGKGNNYVLQTTITKKENGHTMMFDHPVVNERPINLYLDNEDRLYITTGGYFNDAGVYIGPSASSPAYIYVSKGPINL